MKAYNLQSFLDLLEVKGLLTKRQDVEVSVLCHLNMQSTTSLKIVTYYATLLLFYFGLMGLLILAGHQEWINLSQAQSQLNLALIFSLIGAFLSTMTSHLPNNYFYISQLTTRLFVITSALFMIWAAHLFMNWTGLGLAGLFILLNYIYFQDKFIRFSVASLFGLYVFLYEIPAAFNIHAFMLISLTTISLFLFKKINKAILPLFYACLLITTFEAFSLTINQQIDSIFQNLSFSNILFHLGLFIVTTCHILSLGLTKIKPISISFLVGLIVCSILFSFISPILMLVLTFLLIGYRHVNYLTMIAATSLLVTFCVLYFYQMQIPLLSKSIAMIMVGILLFATHKLMSRYQSKNPFHD